MIKYKHLVITLIATISAAFGHAAEPDGYYSSCENKSGAALLSALHSKIGPHTTVGYNSLWDLFKTTDIKPNGKLWDMYSTKEWTPGSQKCGSYQRVGDCYNREHSFPKSWFNDASPMYSDAFHLYPTDGKVNGQRSNYPFGECANGTTLPANGSVQALGRLGTSTFAGYSGKVFEPADEYKGDFARSYFYMAAAYNDRIANWNSDMLAKNAYPAFSSWAIDLLLKWHRQDPVSEKETKRNDAVYARQNNRNPFIDHPEMVEYIWGNKKTEAWSLNISAEPKIVTPVDGSALNMGNVGVGVARTANVTVQSINLTSPVTVSIAGAGFSVSQTSIPASDANASSGRQLTITLKAQTAGQCSGRLTLTSGNLTSTLNITATAYNGLPASEPTNISDRSFMAHWTYIGNDDSNGCYQIYVTDDHGETVDTYPRSVPARDEAYLVDELEPETQYSYYISNGELRSNVITLSTKAPIPMIQFMYDGELEIEALPGEPSEAYELLVDVENIDTDITVSVTEPFELSTDKADWSRTITLSPDEDRMYLRVNSDKEGVFTTSIVATIGDYTTDDDEVTATVTSTPDFIEDFEPKGSNNYSSGAYNGTAAAWLTTDAGVFNIKSEAYEESGYLRMGKTSSSSLTLNAERTRGIGSIEFMATSWRGDGEAKIDVQYSHDQGQTWTTAGTVTLPSCSSGPTSADYNKYTVAVNRPGNVSLRLLQTAGSRVCIDNVSLTNHSAGLEGVNSDYRSWDAYCRDHQLVIELAKTSTVRVYGVDGITYADSRMSEGTTTMTLPAGLYIIAVDDFTRRVLVK